MDREGGQQKHELRIGEPMAYNYLRGDESERERARESERAREREREREWGNEFTPCFDG